MVEGSVERMSAVATSCVATSLRAIKDQWYVRECASPVLLRNEVQVVFAATAVGALTPACPAAVLGGE